MNKTTCRLNNSAPKIKRGHRQATRVNEGPTEGDHPGGLGSHFHQSPSDRGIGLTGAYILCCPPGCNSRTLVDIRALAVKLPGVYIQFQNKEFPLEKLLDTNLKWFHFTYLAEKGIGVQKE